LPAVRLVTVVVESVVVPVTTMFPVVVELVALRFVMLLVVELTTLNVEVPVDDAMLLIFAIVVEDND
jgi:hypothetical protein